jgi:hypothetical protein
MTLQFFSEHNEIKQEIIKRNNRNCTNTYKLKNMLLSDHWVNKKSKGKFKMFLKHMKMEMQHTKLLWDTEKLEQGSLYQQVTRLQSRKIAMNNLMTQFKQQQQQTKLKIGRRKEQRSEKINEQTLKQYKRFTKWKVGCL